MDMVNTLPLDYLHLGCLDVMKTMVGTWLQGARNRFCSNALDTFVRFSSITLKVYGSIPCEFPRKR